MYASHAYHRIKAPGQLLISCRDTAEFFEPTERAFHDVPLTILGLIKASWETRTRVSLHLSLSDDGLDPKAITVTAQFLAIVALVSHDIAATLAWPTGAPRQVNPFHGGHEVSCIRFLTRRKRESDGPAKAITDQMYFGCDAATAPT